MTASAAPAPARSPVARPTAGMIDERSIYSRQELCRLLGWQRHSWRRAKRLGLRVVTFGSRQYIRGQWVAQWFNKLATDQAGAPGQGATEAQEADQ